MSWGQDFLTGFFGGQGLKDYAHASKTFRTNGYELAPRKKFLFHVYFNLNTAEIPTLRNIFSASEQAELGLLVKTIQLPNYTLDTEVLNQYNRKRIIQKKINYLPVSMTFHDDAGDLSRNLWYNYYSYYYKDASQKYGNDANTNGTAGQSQNKQNGFGGWERDIYSDNRQVNDWGYIGESISDGTSSRTVGGDTGKPPFFRDIRIYGMDQHKFAEYVLINPLISNWSHDQYNYSEGNGIMQNSMTISYETVKYYTGAIGSQRPDVNVQGFADPAHYDTTVSSLARPGSTRTIFGQGGLLDAGGGILSDLQSGGLTGLIGAAQKAGTAYNTFKGKNLASLAKSEAIAIGTGAITSGIKNNAGRFFPTPKSPPTN